MKPLIRLLSIALVYCACITENFAQTFNYADALQKSIMFYEAQQSGPLPAFNRVSWRGPSALNDGSDVSKDLTGGWYDAGDHVKFGFPMAYSATILGWGAIDFKDGYVKSGQYTALKNNLRFVYDYLIKCHTAPNELYGQVGNGGIDHGFWGAPEIMRLSRPSYKIDAANPGTELAMETAAALAAGSIIFATEDPTYSATLLRHAKELYTFGNTFRGKYSTAISDAAGYYNSFSGFQDELVWGAIWLYRATNDATYLANAEREYDLVGTEGQTAFKPYKFGLAWDDKIYGCYPLLAKLTGKAKYYADVERNLDFWTDGFNGERITYTPGGLAWLIQWGSLRYSSNTAFVALQYIDLPSANAAKKTKYKNFAIRQINYALGDNPSSRSYVCGFGVNPPRNPHHRGAHGNWTNNLTGPPTTSRHILYGALVGGPNASDGYADDRGDFIRNEVATDYNSGFSGALARIISDGPAVTPPAIPRETPSEEFLSTIKTNSTGTTYFEPSVRVNNRTAWPARIPAKLSFRYFINISEGVAKGYTISNYSVALGGYAPNATLTPGFTRWSGNVYYVEVVYNNVLIYPGGQSESQRECQFRMTGPADGWDPTNDFSYTGITATETQTNFVPMYENGVLVYGTEPPGGNNVVASISATPVLGKVPLVVNFSGAGSTGPAGVTLSYAWAFGDGTTGTGLTTSHTYTAIGSNLARLTVTGSNGTTDSKTITINVVSSNDPPVAKATATPLSGNSPLIVTFDASTSTDPNSDVLTYAWTFGDGTSGTGAKPTHTYNTAGSFVATVTVTDGKGGSSQATVNITVTTAGNTPPTVSITAPANSASFAAGTAINITANAADSNGTVSKVEFFAGATKLGEDLTSPYSFSWTNAAAGTYSLTAKATDNQAATTTSTVVSITVTSVTTGNCKFGAPLAAALPTINSSYTKVYKLGTGGPNLSNVTNFVVNWDLQNNGLWQLSFNTNNGIPTWWIDLRTVATAKFNQVQPEVTFTNSGFPGLDGAYWVALNNGNFVMVSKTGGYTLYFSNAAAAPSCTVAARVETEKSPSLFDSQNSISAFPNPFNETLNIRIQNPEQVRGLYLHDQLGRTIVTVPEKDIAGEIVIREPMQQGLYILRVQSVTGERVIKVIKE
jgi:endoglucanase